MSVGADATYGNGEFLQIVTLTNSGTATLNISGLSISSGPFAIASGSSCQGLATLAGGGTCTINVTYTPSAVGAAPATSLSIVDDASNFPQTVTWTGNGTDFTVTGSTPGTPSATVPAGQPATYNLLLAPVSGFTGTVTMACDAKTLPSATSCTFNPAAPTLMGASVASFRRYDEI